MGDILGGGAEDRATDAQTQAMKEANATQRYMYDTTRADYQPWRQAGAAALSNLTADAGQGGDYMRDFTMADYQQDPGYQFRMDEGMKALQRSAAARGSLNSGGTLKALTKYSQGVASDEFANAYNRFNADRDRRFNRLSSLAGIGQTATNSVAAAGQNYANQVSGNQIGLGNSIAAANIAGANRKAQLFGQLAQGGATVGAAALMASDERLKTNVEPVSKEDLAELKSTLKAYKFNYWDEKYGVGDYVGVMAQDLLKSKLGRSLIVKDEKGFLQIDIRKAVSLFLATIAEGE